MLRTCLLADGLILFWVILGGSLTPVHARFRVQSSAKNSWAAKTFLSGFSSATGVSIRNAHTATISVIHAMVLLTFSMGLTVLMSVGDGREEKRHDYATAVRHGPID